MLLLHAAVFHSSSMTDVTVKRLHRRATVVDFHPHDVLCAGLLLALQEFSQHMDHGYILFYERVS